MKQRKLPMAGFFARTYKEQIVTTGQNVYFGDVLYNEGHNFNDCSSFFVCPVGGYYYFSFTSYQKDTEQLSVGFKKGDRSDQLDLHFKSEGEMPNNMLSLDYVTWCQQNQKVSVTAKNDSYLNSDCNERVTSFMGMFLSGEMFFFLVVSKKLV